MENLNEILSRADHLCYFGSGNYKHLAKVREKFYLLLAELSGAIGLNQSMSFVMRYSEARDNMQWNINLLDLFAKHATTSTTWSMEESNPIETFIAELHACTPEKDTWLQQNYLNTLKAQEQYTEEKFQVFFNDIYLNGIKSMVFGFGNCELRADTLFLELIRTGMVDELHMIHMQPKNKYNQPLEELFFIAVGKWPQKGCHIIVPWFRNHRMFNWEGSLQATPILLEELGEPTADPNKTIFIPKLSLDSASVKSLKTVIDRNHDAFIALRQENLLEIRTVYSLFLNKFVGISSDVTTALQQGQSGPYLPKFEFGIFRLPKLSYEKDKQELVPFLKPKN